MNLETGCTCRAGPGKRLNNTYLPQRLSIMCCDNMPDASISSEILDIRSIEESEIAEIHKRQNEGCRYELSDFLDFSPPWGPMTMDQIKEKLAEDKKRPRTIQMSLWSKDNEFVGIATWSTAWDTWCPRTDILIWPEHRRKGYAREIAKILMEMSFKDNPGHVISTGTPEWNSAAIAFLQTLGLKEIGRMRRIGMKDGDYFDVICYDILKNEYLSLQEEVSQ